MPRFKKQADCTSSAALAALAAGTLSPLARLAADSHLRACDFCAAELRLHRRAATAVTQMTVTAERMTVTTGEPAATTPGPPPMPLALRLFAESKLAESAAVVRRAA